MEIENEDVKDLAAGLAADLGLGKEKEEPVEPAEEPATEPEVKAEPVAEVKAEPAPESEVVADPTKEPAKVAEGGPASWRKEARRKWAELPPWAQEEVMKRDGEQIKGVESLKQAADVGNAFHRTVDRYLPIIQQQGLNAYQLVGQYMEAHRLLAFGTPKQKADVVRGIVRDWQIPLEGLFDPSAEPPAPAPEVSRLQQQITELQATVSRTADSQFAFSKEKTQGEVEAFAKDPAHPFFDEVAEDIVELLNAGACKTLQSAYDTAVARNPAVRQKSIDKAIADKAAAETKAADERAAAARKSTAANVRSSAKARSPTAPKGSMEDTLRETADRLYSP